MSYQVTAGVPPYPPPPYSEAPLPDVPSGEPSAPPLVLMETPDFQPHAPTVDMYATVDKGRLHVAYDQYYQGSINSYNYWFTKLFARILGWSIDIKIGAKHRQVEKKSYLAFLNEHGVVNATMATLHTFTQIDPRSHLRLETKGAMTQALSKGKRRSLTKKMISALLKKEENRTVKTLGRGANVNKIFWINEVNNKLLYVGKNEDTFRQRLPQKPIPSFTATRYTPFLYAGFKRLEKLPTKLITFGANTTLSGLQLSFERVIEDVQTHNNHKFSVQPVLVPCEKKSVSERRYTLTTKNEWRWDKITTTTTTYSDRVQSLRHMCFIDGEFCERDCSEDETRLRKFSWCTSSKNMQNIISFIP